MRGAAERPRSAISRSEVAAHRRIDRSPLIASGANRHRSPVKLQRWAESANPLCAVEEGNRKKGKGMREEGRGNADFGLRIAEWGADHESRITNHEPRITNHAIAPAPNEPTATPSAGSATRCEPRSSLAGAVPRTGMSHRGFPTLATQGWGAHAFRPENRPARPSVLMCCPLHWQQAASGTPGSAEAPVEVMAEVGSRR